MSSSDMQTITHPEPTCRKCNTGMVLHGITPCAERYDIRLYGCRNCSGTLHMVEACTAARASVRERRVVARHRVTTTGTIAFGGSATGCMVRNLSAAGAGLELTRGVEVSQHFTLIADGSHLPCSVIWHREKRIGVAFKPTLAATIDC
jgi:hypothetical protein